MGILRQLLCHATTVLVISLILILLFLSPPLFAQETLPPQSEATSSVEVNTEESSEESSETPDSAESKEPSESLESSEASVSSEAPEGRSPTTYYVDATDGNDANSGTSPDQAWQTLIAVNQAELSPGDTVLFRRGQTWTGARVGLDISASGTKDDPITFSHYGDETEELPTFVATDIFGRAVRLRADWIIIDGLRVTDTPYVGFAIGDDRIDEGASANNNRIQNSRADNVAIGFALFRGWHNTVQGNTARDLRLFPASQTPGPDDDFGAIGFLIQDSKAAFLENTCINCIDDSPDYGVDGSGFEFYARDHDVREVLIARNQVTNTDNAIEVGGQAGGWSGSYQPQHTVSAIIHHNLFVDAEGLHVNLGPYQYAVLVEEFQVHHNTFVRQSTVVDEVVNTTYGALTGDQLQLVNNIFYGYAEIAQDREGEDHVGFIRSHNLYYQLRESDHEYLADSEIALGTQPDDVDQIVHQAFFENWQAGQYQLIDGNPAVDAGVDLGYEQDLDGTPIPQGQRPDIGAFESPYSAPTVTPTPGAAADDEDGTDGDQGLFATIAQLLAMRVGVMPVVTVGELLGMVGFMVLLVGVGVVLWRR